MRKHYTQFLSKTNLLVPLFGLLAVVCLGQNARTLKCQEKDYGCRVNNYVSIVSVACKAEGYDCWIAQQTKIVESNPSDVAAYFYRGQTYLIKDPDRAILDFNKVLELDPKYRLAYSLLASSYKKKEAYDRAIIALNRAIELDSKDADTYDNRGHVYLEQRDFGKALADFNKVIELKPNSDRGYIGRALVYSEQRDFDKALAEYNKVIEVSSRDWLNYYNRGFLYWRQGEKAKADADCQKAKELKRGVRRPIPEHISNEYCSL